MGLSAQLMFGVISLMLNIAATGEYNFELFFPVVVTISQLSSYLLVSASLLYDRPLAVSLNLRYQELSDTKSCCYWTAVVGAFDLNDWYQGIMQKRKKVRFGIET